MDAQKNYEGVFDSSIGFGKKPALILIDFVKAYFDKSCALYANVEEILKNAIRLRDAARQANLLIIYTNVRYIESLVDGGRFVQKIPQLQNFIADNPMGGWPKGLKPRKNELVISKHYPSAFFGTSLASTLTAGGYDSLIITGLTTSGCVRATCVDCCSYGFIPLIAQHSVGDRHQKPHNANLFDMNAKYGDVLPDEIILAYLLAGRFDV